MYIFEMLVIFFGVVLTLTGLKRKNKLFLGMGMGALIAFVVLGIPDFIEGFQRGLS